VNTVKLFNIKSWKHDCFESAWPIRSFLSPKIRSWPRIWEFLFHQD